jgi:DNA polymerase-3 subunit delta'
VGIFDGADKMNAAASNALLKTLEEPPPASLLILISATRSRLLPTIVSRCQPIHFVPLPRETLAAFLAERSDFSKEALSLMSALSGGCPGKAVRMDPEWVTGARREWIDRFHEFLASEPGGALVDFAEDLYRSDRLLEVLDLFEGWYRDVLVFRVGGPERVINRDYLEEIAEAAREQDPMETISRIDSIRQARRDVLGVNNLNKQMVMEGLLLNLSGSDA